MLKLKQHFSNRKENLENALRPSWKAFKAYFPTEVMLLMWVCVWCSYEQIWILPGLGIGAYFLGSGSGIFVKSLRSKESVLTKIICCFFGLVQFFFGISAFRDIFKLVNWS